jgi:hypothetical protein
VCGSAGSILAISLLLALGVRADAAPARPLLLFSIGKSENKNRVEYAVRVDEHCVPESNAPAYAYWRMVEKGPTVTEPLLPIEFDAYGLADQAVTARGESGGRVRVVLRAVPNRPIEIDVSRGPGGSCQAQSTVTINGAAARLYDVYVKLKWPFGVDYLLVRGYSLDGSQVVQETLRR